MFPNVHLTHYFIDCEALMVKIIPIGLKSILDPVVKLVNFIKHKVLKTRILKHMCLEVGSKNDILISL